MASEEGIWRNAAQTVLREANSPLHYLDIKRVILEKGLIRPGLQTTLESVLFKDAGSPSAIFKQVSAQGMFALMTDQERATHQLKFASASTSKSTSMKMKGPAAQLLQSGNVKVIKIKRGPGRPRMHERVHQNGHVINPVINDKYRKKYLKLKKFAKKMLFVNAAVCDEVSRVEDKLAKARAERKFLVKKLLNHQAVSEALCQMAAKQPQAAAAMLGQSLGPGALSKLPVGIAGPLSLDMNQDSSPEMKTKPKKKSVTGSKKKAKDSPLDEKSKAKKKVNVRPGPGTMNPLAAGDQGSGSLRHLLTTKTIMEPP